MRDPSQNGVLLTVQSAFPERTMFMSQMLDSFTTAVSEETIEKVAERLQGAEHGGGDRRQR